MRRSSIRSALAATAALAALAGSAALIAIAAPASAATPVWSPSTACGVVDSTTAPPGVVSMNVFLAGGSGGKGGGQSSGTTGPGGFGGFVLAQVPVNAGTTISAVVGCKGNDGPGSGSTPGAAGYANGGGTGHGQNTAFDPNGAGGGSGGGASAVCLGSSCSTGVSTPLVVAGGGGGSGSSSCSGTTGGPGGQGGAGAVSNGGGGTGKAGSAGGSGASAGSLSAGIAGGAGGNNAAGGSGNGGSSPDGSGGASVNVVGGGGGGGFVGGGAGSNANTGCKAGGAGGGGSSWVAGSAAFAGYGTTNTSFVYLSFNYAPPTAPRSPVAVPGNANVSLSWQAPISDGGSPITGYTITPVVDNVSKTPQTFGPGLSAVVTGLTNGTTYRFKIQAVADGQTGAPVITGPITPGTPLAPAGATLSSGDGSVNIKWTPPSSDNGWPISAYVVTPYIGVNAQPSTTFPTPASGGTVTGLTNGAQYTFRIAAVNKYGAGLLLNSGALIIGAPATPAYATATAGAGSATLKWATPAANAAPITGYVVTPYIGATAQAPKTFNSTATTQVITGLTPGTAYTFRVAAVNALGVGTQARSNTVTPS